MNEEPEDEPFSESSLDSAEYRERLMRKLNCLIAVLEVANAKVRRSLSGPAPDVERLTRIRRNLQETLEVCLRARTALEKRGSLPSALSSDLARAIHPDLLRPRGAARQGARLARGSLVEMTSEREVEKFRRLGRLDPRMVRTCDLDELASRLQG